MGWSPLIVAFLALTLLATLTLYVWADDTNRTFAWTIQPSISAAFLGAGYGAGFLLVALTARERIWANARIALLTVTLFVWLTTLATIVHLDVLHIGDASGFAEFSGWLWLVVYIVVPSWMASMLAVQRRATGDDPPRRHTITQTTATVLAIQAVAMIGAGVLLMSAPRWVSEWWPWHVAPFAGRATGAWLIGLGFAAVVAAVHERDYLRLRAASWAYATFAVLQAAALVRFGGDVRWDLVATWAWLALLASMAAVGIHGIRAAPRFRDVTIPEALGTP